MLTAVNEDVVDNRYQKVSLGQINFEDGLTDFSMGPIPGELETSIREIGITHPVTLTPNGGGRYRLICGHRRARIASRLGFGEIPAVVWEPAPDRETMLATNIAENLAHRRYTDVEKGRILSRLLSAGVTEEQILEKYMPKVGLEKSKKLFRQYLEVTGLSAGFQKLLHDLNVSLRVWTILCRWDTASRNVAEVFFGVLRPGINKWRDLLELLDETAQRDGCTPADLLGREDLLGILNLPNLSPQDKYDRIAETLRSRRYPVLTDLTRKVARLLDEMKLHPATIVRTSQTFETGELRIELKFRTRDELLAQMEKLGPAAQSDAMRELIDLYRNMD
ncbi:MAG: hypothetical protein COV67_06980 [Nitrospinae bacterium CG11_big_fil_rev_8_21_14_0_20_56_8]|nr:MAG: hypothetical protein COV67_06980 [Nitrospinae bacterium CG11_big_fil_rev_8_21_14_0_20_56_8]